MDLVVIPFHDWKKCEQEGFRTRDAHFILELSKRTDVDQILVVDRPVSLPEILLKRYDWKVANGEVLYRHNNVQLTHVAPKIFVLDILELTDIIRPIRLRKRWWADVLNRARIHTEIRRASDYLNISDYGLLVFTPLAYGLIDKLKEDYLLFFAVDNWLLHPQMQQVKEEVKAGYQKFSLHADAIITTSESLKELFEPNNSNVHFIANGVTPELFTRESINIPQDMRHISGPIVGYAGKIQERLDVELLQYLIKKLSHINFVFIGQMISPGHFSPLQGHSNVYYLGDKPYSVLPDYLATFDVCIVPHVQSDFTASMSPLKLFEYLAAHKPVVTTSSMGLELDKNWIFVSSDATDFLDGIQFFLQNKPEAPFVVPVEWTWKAKTEEVVTMIKSIRSTQ